MSKYSFSRMEPMQFERMAQALLENTYRIKKGLIQFGLGKDGGREATWSQKAEKEGDTAKQWIFQVKYHDLEQNGLEKARKAVITDLDAELNKIVNVYKLHCDVYIMMTNVPFTGAINVGTRDQISKKRIEKWKSSIPEIEVWDAADISRMLDADTNVRTAYLNTILIGDVIQAMYDRFKSEERSQNSTFKAYLNFITDREADARTGESGDEENLSLDEVFIDLNLSSKDESLEELFIKQPSNISSDEFNFTEQITEIPASSVLFLSDNQNMLLLGGPGLGKSTLTQFLTLYHAARMINPCLSESLAGRLKLPQEISAKDLEAYSRPRYPFRVELRHYATWMSQQKDNNGELARFIAEELINRNTSSNINMDAIFNLADQNPILLILDGLDEVPNPEARKIIIENLKIFLRRTQGGTEPDIQVVISSRPNGYSGEFSDFKPIIWTLNELTKEDFNDYCNQWLHKRIKDAQERKEAQERIDRGMASEAVQRLAKSLLQATVILTIIKNKREIPQQRNELFEKYVDVIFAREDAKSQLVHKYNKELRRLHERVGFELHSKMERANIEAIDRETFRHYIQDVLEDYSGKELGKKTIRDVVNEIIEATTDRLCLLVGKGKDQKDVDFILQQYREYFAALYLSNHPNANSIKVLNMLVERGAYWAYVLQFYVAQAKTSEQMSWILNISDNDDNSPEDTIKKIRGYRAILQVLPECYKLKTDNYKKILKRLFHQDIRWMWLNEGRIKKVLKLRDCKIVCVKGKKRI